MVILERASKAATAVSVVLIVALQLAVHPDITTPLQVAGGLAFIAGWLAGNAANAGIQFIWILIAPLSPALLHQLTGLEGPVLDIPWMAGLAGSLLRTNSWTRWDLPPVWRVLVGGWALTLSLAWPVLVAREIGFDLRGFEDVAAINSWAGLSAPQVVAWIFYVVLTQLLGVLWLDWLIGRFNQAPDRLPRVAHALWIGATIASVVAVVQGTIDISFLSTPSWASLGRATGTMMDANPYGVLAALAGPVAFIVLSSSEHAWARAVAIVALAVNFLGMWMSGSRTALLCAIAGSVALVITVLRQPRPGARRFAVGAIATVFVVVIVLVAGAVGPWRRLVDVPLSREGASSVVNRGPYGPIAVEMLRAYPLAGVGIGAYHILAPDYWRRVANDRLPFDNAQNWWRHQAAELGILGVPPIFIWSLLVAWLVVAGRGRASSGPTVPVRGLLLGIGLSSFFGIPTQNPVATLWFFFLVAWLLGLTEHRGIFWISTGRWMGVAAIVTMTMAIAYASIQAVFAYGSLSVAERAKRTNRDYVEGAYSPESMPNGNTFRWTDDASRFVWIAKTRWLVVRVRVQHPDVATRPVRVTLTTACQTLFDEEMRSSAPMSLGLELPEGTRSIDVFVRVSRTWQPSAYGAADTRRLGAAVLADFETSREQGLAQSRAVQVRECAR